MFRLLAVVLFFAMYACAIFNPEVQLIPYIDEDDSSTVYQVLGDAKHLVVAYSLNAKSPFNLNPDASIEYITSDSLFREFAPYPGDFTDILWKIYPSDDSIQVYFKSLWKKSCDKLSWSVVGCSLTTSTKKQEPRIERRQYLSFDFVFYIVKPFNFYDYVFPVAENLEHDKSDSLFYFSVTRSHKKLAVYFDSKAKSLVQVNPFSEFDGTHYFWGLESAFLSEPLMYPDCPAKFSHWRDFKGKSRCVIKYEFNAMSANQEQTPAHQDTTRDTTLILGWFTEQQWHDLMKNSVGPCHGPTNVKKCCQWKKDSIAVKRTENDNDRLETLRHCCYSVDCEEKKKKEHK